MIFDPRTACVLVKVLTRADCFVERFEIKPGILRSDRRRGEDQANGRHQQLIAFQVSPSYQALQAFAATIG